MTPIWLENAQNIECDVQSTKGGDSVDSPVDIINKGDCPLGGTPWTFKNIVAFGPKWP